MSSLICLFDADERVEGGDAMTTTRKGVKVEWQPEKVVLKSSGEVVAVLYRPSPADIERAKEILKGAWPEGVVTVKEIYSNQKGG